MFCVKCGKEVPDNTAFCNHCGNQMKSTSNINTSNQSICFKCSGMGVMRSTAKMVICGIIAFLLFLVQISSVGFMEIFLGEDFVMIWLLFAIAIDISILYFGFRKKMCPVCHGRGKVNL